MHTFDRNVPIKASLARNPGSDVVRVLLILGTFAATGAGLSALSTDPDPALQPSAQIDTIEDWHGNVARSGR